MIKKIRGTEYMRSMRATKFYINCMHVKTYIRYNIIYIGNLFYFTIS